MDVGVQQFICAYIYPIIARFKSYDVLLPWALSNRENIALVVAIFQERRRAREGDVCASFFHCCDC